MIRFSPAQEDKTALKASTFLLPNLKPRHEAGILTRYFKFIGEFKTQKEKNTLETVDAEAFVHPEKNLKKVMQSVLRNTDLDESCFFLDGGALRSNLESFQKQFLPHDPRRRILFAMKANPKNEVLKTFIQGGIDGFDCASWQEIKAALENGARPENIYFNNPVQRRSHIKKAIGAGVRYLTIQSMSGIDKILDSCSKKDRSRIEIAVRIRLENPEAEIKMSNSSGKYGCTVSEAKELLLYIKKVGLRCGMAIHLGSQNQNPESFKKNIDVLSQIAMEVGGVCSINMGGGFPVNHKREDKYVVKPYLDSINLALSKLSPKVFCSKNEKTRLIIEPGRGLVASAFDLLIPIIEIRNKNKIYFANGIFNSFSDHYLHGWKYEFEAYSPLGKSFSKKFREYKLFGETCDPKDGFNSPVELPEDIKEGDFLWVKNAGAYMDSQRSNFNGFEQPKCVLYNL